MFLRAHGDYYQPIDESLPELKDLVAEAVGQPIRRISRFMQLALIGAGRCARGVQLPRDTAVYLASSRGDLEISVDVLNHMFREGQSPKPLSFVNTVSNSAAFYVAKCLRLESRSAFVSSRYFAFEDALLLALTDFQLGNVDSALIGCVDSAALPLSAHRERLEVHATTQLAEASHWMWFTRETNASALAQVIDVSIIGDRQAAVEWTKVQALDSTHTFLCAGQYLSVNDFADVQTQTGLSQSFDYRSTRSYYASQSAAAIPTFVSANTNGHSLLHFNVDSLGRFAALQVRK